MMHDIVSRIYRHGDDNIIIIMYITTLLVLVTKKKLKNVTSQSITRSWLCRVVDRNPLCPVAFVVFDIDTKTTNCQVIDRTKQIDLYG